MTLVEMLVVLAIVGVVAGAATIGIGAATRPPSAEAEARRLASRIQIVADEGMVTETATALSWDRRGYGFVRQGEAGWAAETSDALGDHRLPGGMTLEGGSGAILPIGSDGGGRPIALRLKSAAGNWLIRYDGVTAAAVAAR